MRLRFFQLALPIATFGCLSLALWHQVRTRDELLLRYRALADTAARVQAEADRARERLANAAGNDLRARSERALSNAYAARIRAAAAALERDDLIACEEHLDRAPEDLHAFEWDFLRRAAERTVRPLCTLDGLVAGIAARADGGLAVALDDGGTVVSFSLADGAVRSRRSEWTATPAVLAFAEGGARVAVGLEDGRVYVLDPERLDEAEEIHEFPFAIRDLAISESGSVLAAAGEGGEIAVLERGSGRRLDLGAGLVGATRIALDRSGGRVAIAGAGGSVRLLDARTGAAVHAWDGSFGMPLDVAIGAEGSAIAVLDDKGGVHAFRAGSDRPVLVVGSALEPRSACGMTADGRFVFVARGDDAIDVHDTTVRNPSRPIRTLRFADGPAESVAIANDGATVLIGAPGGEILLWSRDATTAPRAFPSARRWIRALATDWAGLAIVAGAADGRVRVHDGDDGRVIRELAGHDRAISALALEGDLLLSADAGGGVILWNREEGTRRFEARSAPDIVAVGLLPDAAIAVSRDGTVGVWEPEGGGQIARRPAAPYAILAVDRSLQDGAIAWSAVGGNFRAWDARTGGKLAGFRLDAAERVEAVDYHAASGRVAVAMRNSIIEFWSAGERRRDARVRPRPLPATCLAFSDSGQRVAAGYPDGDLVVLDPASGEILIELEVPSDSLAAVLFSPDDQRLIAAGKRGRLYVFE